MAVESRGKIAPTGRIPERGYVAFKRSDAVVRLRLNSGAYRALHHNRYEKHCKRNSDFHESKTPPVAEVQKTSLFPHRRHTHTSSASAEL